MIPPPHDSTRLKISRPAELEKESSTRLSSSKSSSSGSISKTNKLGLDLVSTSRNPLTERTPLRTQATHLSTTIESSRPNSFKEESNKSCSSSNSHYFTVPSNKSTIHNPRHQTTLKCFRPDELEDESNTISFSSNSYYTGLISKINKLKLDISLTSTKPPIASATFINRTHF